MVNRRKIVSEKKVSRKTLSKKFKPFFDSPLKAEEVWRVVPPKICTDNSPWVYGVDGKWLRRNGVIIIHRDITHKQNLFWSFHKSESFEALKTDLEKLSSLISHSGGNYPVGAVSDWKQAIISAVGAYFGPIPHQRCTSHVLRLARNLLPKKSPIEATLKLRKIALELKDVSTNNQKRKWQKKIVCWKKEYGYLLKEKTVAEAGHAKRWWYTHGNLRRGFRLLTNDQDSLFVYLDNKLIPRSNNSLEGTNSQLNKRIKNHRGMKLNQQISFIFWYLTFNGEGNNISKLRKLWAYWRKSYIT